MPVHGLAVLADAADARLADALAAGSGGPSVLRVRTTDDDVELGLLPLRTGEHPLDQLIGTVAPADWWAVGIAATGVAHHLDAPGSPPTPVRTVHLVARDGTWASRCAPIDGEGPDLGPHARASGDADSGERPVGRGDDICRRVLGLPTPPPSSTTAELWALQWLDGLLDAIVGEPRPGAFDRWRTVAARHPAVRALVGAEAAMPTPKGLAELARQLTSWRDWPALRRACASGTWTAPGLDADLAGWLDDGSFARWTVGAYPELADLRAMVAAVLGDPVATLVEATLTRSGVTPC